MLGSFYIPVTIMTTGYFIQKRLPGASSNASRIIIESIIVGVSLLVIPGILLSHFTDALLDTWMYIYFVFSWFSFLMILLSIMWGINISNYRRLRTMISKIDKLWFLLGLLLLDYVILAFIYPARGWDALQAYLPMSEFMYLTDDYDVGFNPFTFFPTTKAPVNVFLISYGYYINKEFSAELIPVLFLLGTSLLCYELCKLIDISNRGSIFGAIFYLILPFTYIHFLEFSYYQELPLGLFYPATIIYFKISMDKAHPIYFQLIAGLSFSLAILSKISGFSLFFLLVIVFAPYLNNRFKMIALIDLSIIFSLLSIKSATTQYVGSTLVILSIAILILFILIRSEGQQKMKVPTITLLLSSFTALLWLLRLAEFEGALKALLDLYFSINTTTPVFHFPQLKNISGIYLENAHISSVVTTLLLPFLSFALVPLLLIPKFVGLKQVIKDHKWVIIWFLSFFAIWLTYHGLTSIRYLQPLIVAFVGITIQGIEVISERYTSQTSKSLIYLSLIFTSFPFYFPHLPISFSTLSFHQRLFNFHSSWVTVLVYVLIISILMVRMWKLRTLRMSKVYLQRIKVLLLILLILLPVSVQFYVLIDNKGNLETTQSFLSHDNRETLTEAVDFLSGYGKKDTILIGVNIPGFAYFSKRPVIDLFVVSQFEMNFDLNQLTSKNVTEVYENLKSNNIGIIVTLLPEHGFYSDFDQDYVSVYLFFDQPDTRFTVNLFSNSEFAIWEVL